LGESDAFGDQSLSEEKQNAAEAPEPDSLAAFHDFIFDILFPERPGAAERRRLYELASGVQN
jgi:hypothetical protein